MTVSRRRFMQWAAAVTAAGAPRLRADDSAKGFRAELLPSQKEIWDQQVWMAKLGPKYTGNRAHTEFVEFLAREMAKLGLDVVRDRYTFDRWETTSPATIKSGASFAVSSYFPYSGETPREGVT